MCCSCYWLSVSRCLPPLAFPTAEGGQQKTRGQGTARFTPSSLHPSSSHAATHPHPPIYEHLQTHPAFCCAVKGLELYKESIASNEALANYYATIEQIEEVGRRGTQPRRAAAALHFCRQAALIFEGGGGLAAAPLAAHPFRPGSVPLRTQPKHGALLAAG